MKAASMTLRDNSLQILADDNHLGAGYRFDNQDELVNNGELIVVGDLSRDTDEIVNLGIKVLPTSLHINSKEWNILPSEIDFRGGDIDVKSFELSSGDQHIRFEGRASQTQKDTLTLSLDKFSIGMINPILKSDMNIQGSVTGKVQLTSPLKSKGLLADIICDSTSIARGSYGHNLSRKFMG